MATDISYSITESADHSTSSTVTLITTSATTTVSTSSSLSIATAVTQWRNQATSDARAQILTYFI